MKNKVALSVVILSQQGDRFLKQVQEAVKRAEQVLTVDLSGQVINDFSGIRNEALKKATQDWVLFIDSDEVVTADSWAEIERLIVLGKPALIKVIRQDVFLDQKINHGEAGKIKLARLGRREKIKWQRPIHEVLVSDDPEISSSIKLLHYSHQSVGHFVEKVARYARLEAEFRHQQGKNFNWWELVFWPPAKFIFNYFFKLGFLDGWPGLIYAVVMSCHSLWVRVNLYELEQKN